MIGSSFLFGPNDHRFDIIVIISILLMIGIVVVRLLVWRGVRVPEWLHIVATGNDIIFLGIGAMVLLSILSIFAK